MRTASNYANSRSGAVVIGSEREPAKKYAAIESAKCGGPSIDIQVLLSRVGTVKVGERAGRSGVGYDSLGGVVVLSRRGRGSIRAVRLTALAIRTTGTSFLAVARTATMTTGRSCVLFGTAGMGRFVAPARFAATTDFCARARATAWTCLVTSAARLAHYFRTGTRRRRQSLDGDRHGCEPDQSASGNVFSNPHDGSSQQSPPSGRRDSFSLIGSFAMISTGQMN